MAGIVVNSTAMRQKSETLKGIAKSIKSFTDDMLREMESLRNTWEGDVAETTVQRFKGLSDNFEERYNTINAYADFLLNAADEWDKVQNAALSAAESQAT